MGSKLISEIIAIKSYALFSVVSPRSTTTNNHSHTSLISALPIHYNYLVSCLCSYSSSATTRIGKVLCFRVSSFPPSPKSLTTNRNSGDLSSSERGQTSQQRTIDHYYIHPILRKRLFIKDEPIIRRFHCDF